MRVCWPGTKIGMRVSVAGAIASLLGVVTTVLVALGVLATPWLIPVIAPGFHGERRELCVALVRVFFPATGLLVWSAWCLAISE
jgi:putative peptidoglycan lipid II flippase